jgi:hypothetical protein
MSLTIEPRFQPAEAAPTAIADVPLWHHAAFCRVALPHRTPRTAWQREADNVLVRLEPASAVHPLPGGLLLRLALLDVCDAAVRQNSAVVEVGESADVMAARLGADAKPRDLHDQVERMLAAKISVSIDGEPELAVFDARGRPRSAGSAWRPSVRLSTGFFASLVTHAVPLDRKVVGKLAVMPLALDAYAWIRQALRNRPADYAVTVPWAELHRRFGTPSQDVAAFRPSFEAALRAVFEADLSTALAVDDEGVSIGTAAPSGEQGAADDDPRQAISAQVTTAPAAETEEPLASPPVAPQPMAAPAELLPTPGASPSPAASDLPARPITTEMISLRQHATGLNQVIWLRRSDGRDHALVGVTPGGNFDPDRLTVLAVEPMVLQISGGLSPRDLERVTAWVIVNRDLIDDFWDGLITSYDEVGQRLRRVPAPGVR